MRWRAAVAGLLLAAAAFALPARALALETGMEDERLLLDAPGQAAPLTAAWQRIGVDVVRIHARWWALAPDRDATRAPRGFDAANPADPRYDWTSLDVAVTAARAAGLRVMLTVTGPGPLWSTRDPSRRNALFDPDPQQFGRFAHAVAARYGAQVDRYLVWNEPNQPGWLQPQWSCSRAGCVPASPHLYRRLLAAAVSAIDAADPGSEVLMGELASLGDPPRTTRTPMAPLPFLRALGCVDRAYRPLRTGACRGFRAPAADAFGYHPHPRASAPLDRNPDRDDAQLGDLGRLFGVLDRLTDRGRLRVSDAPRRTPFPVYMTEFGYQTSPPDRALGVSLARQSAYLQQAAYLCARRSRIRGLSFYQWDDEPVADLGPGTRRYAGWQSGLRTLAGRPKPALATFPAPFVLDRARGRATGLLWGQARTPVGPGGVTLEVRPRGAGAFVAVLALPTAADGSFTRRVRVRAGASYRFAWTPPATAADPQPAPLRSGVIDLARASGSRLQASLARPEARQALEVARPEAGRALEVARPVAHDLRAP